MQFKGNLISLSMSRFDHATVIYQFKGSIRKLRYDARGRDNRFVTSRFDK